MRLTRLLAIIPALMLLYTAGFVYAQDEAGPRTQALPVAETDQSAEPDAEELAGAFTSFKEAMDAGSLDEADMLAKRVVEYSIRLFGPGSSEAARALTNLAIVQHRQGQYDAAQQNFASAIEIIEDTDDRLSKALLNPLKGLGAAQLESGRPDLAIATFDRAVHVTHVNEGPHNMEQVEVLESIAETNSRLGLYDDAKKAQDRIYSLTSRHFRSEPLSLVQPLMRRAAWQHRVGFFNDERATYRKIIRIIEQFVGKDDVMLIEPLIKLGQSYYFFDSSIPQSNQSAPVSNGELYFKRAHRIAESDEGVPYLTLAEAKLALADFYLSRTNQGRARGIYAEAWDLLSADEVRLDDRFALLEQPVLLQHNQIPKYVGKATAEDEASQDDPLLTGTVAATYMVTARGRVAEFVITASTPGEFTDITRIVQRELRSRLYRPAHVAGKPVDTPGQEYTHNFFYRQSDLDRVRQQLLEKKEALREQDER